MVRCLDLYCGGGGAGAGYAAAGFDVTGVDLFPQPGYPFPFVQCDALEYVREHGHLYDFIHGSPPCQPHSVLRHANDVTYEDLVPATREAFEASGKPWVIENVESAPLRSPVTLCGSMFGLGAGGYRLERHRKFEASFPLSQPPDACRDDPRPVVGVYGGKVRNRRAVPGSQAKSRVGTTLPLSLGQEAMGILWLGQPALSQAIPPAYTRWIAGEWLRAH